MKAEKWLKEILKRSRKKNIEDKKERKLKDSKLKEYGKPT